ncbi:hypothetical protein GCM10020255_014860 [Rhodococcus baikonurensis]
MMAEFAAALVEATQSGARALILTGKGRAFAAGADIAEMRDRTFGSMSDANHLALWERLADLPIPTIGAINGFALGGAARSP